MTKTIYVGNLPYNSTENDLRSLFEPHGMVHSVKIISDRDSGRSKGFGFVEMDMGPADSAIEALNGLSLAGRALRVNEAKERKNDAGRGRDAM